MVIIPEKTEENGKRRDKMGTDLDVLKIAMKPRKCTGIMYDSNQSWGRHKERIKELERDHLIQRVDQHGNPDESGVFYQVTNKGLGLKATLEWARRFYCENSSVPDAPNELKIYLLIGNKISIHEPESVAGSSIVCIRPAAKYRQTI